MAYLCQSDQCIRDGERRGSCHPQVWGCLDSFLCHRHGYTQLWWTKASSTGSPFERGSCRLFLHQGDPPSPPRVARGMGQGTDGRQEAPRLDPQPVALWQSSDHLRLAPTTPTYCQSDQSPSGTQPAGHPDYPCDDVRQQVSLGEGSSALRRGLGLWCSAPHEVGARARSR